MQCKDSWASLLALPAADLAENSDVFHLIETKKLSSTGIGFIDAHLLASAILENGRIYTRDKKLKAVAASLKIDLQ